MRMRVTADDVAAAPQVADAGGVEERGVADATGDDEEVTQPTAPRQLVAHGERALAAVVERQQQVPARRREIDRRDERRATVHGGHRLEMTPEGDPTDGVGGGATPLEPRLPRVVRHVVVGEGGGDRFRDRPGSVPEHGGLSATVASGPVAPVVRTRAATSGRTAETRARS